MSDDFPQAVVREIDGQLVLDDPVALDILRAFQGISLEKTLALNADRVAHFKRRLLEKNLTPQEACIVIINVDNSAGRPLADELMPGANWDSIRATGALPFARGLAMRDGIQQYLTVIDQHSGLNASKELQKAQGVAVVVLDHEMIAVFESPLEDNNTWTRVLLDGES